MRRIDDLLNKCEKMHRNHILSKKSMGKSSELNRERQLKKAARAGIDKRECLCAYGEEKSKEIGANKPIVI